MLHSFFLADALYLPIANKSIDLVFTSPPYPKARHYGCKEKFVRSCEDWIEWMYLIVKEQLRVCKGPVLINCAGFTKDRNYFPAPEGILHTCWQRGTSAYRPIYWHRVGIPGGGGNDWYRPDIEYVLCFKEKGEFPWSNTGENGHPPKYGLGGEMSYRGEDGKRKNFRQKGDSTVKGGHERKICKVANHGNLLSIPVGGGLLGHKLAHLNEAPFPVKLPEFFIRSHCPVGGTVLDPFCGSGSTSHAAENLGRNSIGCDIRKSQIELSKKRIGEITHTHP